MDPDDAVERWHNSDDDALPFLEFMAAELGWTEDEVKHWVETAEEPKQMADERIVYGAGCTWWGTIDEISKTTSGLPICPHCGSPLFEVENEAEWWRGAAEYEANGHPGYQDFLRWLRVRHFRSQAEAQAAYDAEKGG